MATQTMVHEIAARSRKNLNDAMHGEAFAYAKYKMFAKQALKSGHTELAHLFDKVANEEFFEHFAEESELLGLAGSDEQNLQHAIAGESFEIDTMYKEYAEAAREDGDLDVASRFDEIRHDESKHRLGFERALIQLQTRDRILKTAGSKKR
jgi:rubrerythrin